MAIHADDADHARSQETELDDALEVGGTVGLLEVVDASGKSPGEVAWLRRFQIGCAVSPAGIDVPVPQPAA